MLPPRPKHPKEKEVYDLSNDEKFSSDRNVKASTILHLSYILFLGWKLTFAMATIGMFFSKKFHELDLSRFWYK
jgi:hypothetical protein